MDDAPNKVWRIVILPQRVGQPTSSRRIVHMAWRQRNSKNRDAFTRDLQRKPRRPESSKESLGSHSSIASCFLAKTRGAIAMP